MGPKFKDKCPYKETQRRDREEEMAKCRQSTDWSYTNELALVFCYRESYYPKVEISLPSSIRVTFS